MKRKKILQAIRQGQVGGGESHVMELVANMDRTKYEPVVLSFTDGPMVDTLRKEGITTKVIQTERPFNFSVWHRVTKLIKEEGIDLVHAHGTRALSNVFRSAKQLTLPLIYTVHGWSFHPDQSPLVRQVRERAEQFLTRKADTTICVSQSNEQDGISRLKMERSQVIHNAINLDKYNPNQSFKNLRAEFGFTEDDFVIGFIVRITTQKDPFTMLNAMRLLCERNSKVKLLVVGDGDLKPQAIEKVKALGIADRVVFQPFRRDIPDVLNAIDLYCLPSLWEGFPIGILEAMAMCKPVVATPVDGTKELIKNNYSGFYTELKDARSLAELIQMLTEHSGIREEVAQNAFEFVHAHFGIKRQVKKVEAIYHQSLL